MATLAPKINELVASKKQVMELTHSSPLDEAAIRAQVQSASIIVADLAVERAKIAQQIRQILTAEQVAELQKLHEQRSDRMNSRLDRMAKFLEF